MRAPTLTGLSIHFSTQHSLLSVALSVKATAKANSAAGRIMAVTQTSLGAVEADIAGVMTGLSTAMGGNTIVPMVMDGVTEQ